MLCRQFDNWLCFVNNLIAGYVCKQLDDWLCFVNNLITGYVF